MRRLSGDIRQQSREEIEKFIQEQGGDQSTLNDAEKQTINEMRAKAERKQMNLSVGKVAEIRQDFINKVEAQADMNLSMSLISPSAAFVFFSDGCSEYRNSERMEFPSLCYSIPSPIRRAR